MAPQRLRLLLEALSATDYKNLAGEVTSTDALLQSSAMAKLDERHAGVYALFVFDAVADGNVCSYLASGSIANDAGAYILALYERLPRAVPSASVGTQEIPGIEVMSENPLIAFARSLFSSKHLVLPGILRAATRVARILPLCVAHGTDGRCADHAGAEDHGRGGEHRLPPCRHSGVLAGGWSRAGSRGLVVRPKRPPVAPGASRQAAAFALEQSQGNDGNGSGNRESLHYRQGAEVTCPSLTHWRLSSRLPSRRWRGAFGRLVPPKQAALRFRDMCEDRVNLYVLLATLLDRIEPDARSVLAGTPILYNTARWPQGSPPAGYFDPEGSLSLEQHLFSRIAIWRLQFEKDSTMPVVAKVLRAALGSSIRVASFPRCGT